MTPFFVRRALAALVLLLAPAVAFCNPARILELRAPSLLDRQSGPGDVGGVVSLRACVTNPAASALRVDSAAVHFATTAVSVDAQYLVTRPVLPLLVAAGSSQVLTFLVRPWATATVSTPVTVCVTLRSTDLSTGARPALSATTNWIVSEGADLFLGQPAASVVEGVELGLDGAAGVHSDGARLFVADSRNCRVLVYKPIPTGNHPRPTLVLGQANLSTRGGSATVQTDPASFYGPRSVISDGRRLYVADTGNNRVLIYNSIPTASHARPDVVVGQPDHGSDAPNNEGLTAASLSEPASVWSDGRRLIVADSLNNRVLIWTSIPSEDFAPADVVLGQGLFTSNTANNGSLGPSTLTTPGGVWFDGARLFVADTGNHRVLIWNGLPSVNFEPADLVLGQPDFASGQPNAGAPAPTARSLFRPASVQTDGVRLLVSDASNNRVLVWNHLPAANYTPADVAIGQSGLTTGTRNAGGLGAASLNLELEQLRDRTLYLSHAFSDGERLYVSDPGNNRVLRFDRVPATHHATADQVIGQPSFTTHAFSNPGLASGRIFILPFAVAAWNGRLVVADANGNRVLIYNSMPRTSFASADVVLGQPDLESTSPNAGGLSARSLNGPRQVAIIDGRLFVSDTYNHRVLVWSSMPTSSFAPANLVLGQPGFASGDPNAGLSGPGPATMSLPGGVVTDGRRLYVADRGNNRVLVFSEVPATSGAAATLALGQPDLTSGQPNRGGLPGADTMMAPFALACDSRRLFVDEVENHRVLIFNTLPQASGAAAEVVLGQPDFIQRLRTNGGLSARSMSDPAGVASDGERLVVSDQVHSRLLVWDSIPATSFATADGVIGQPDFLSHEMNPGGASAFTLAIPLSVCFVGPQLWAVDARNQRVLRYDLPERSRVRLRTGGDRLARLGETVVLEASATSPASGPISYAWVQETPGDDLQVDLEGASSARASFVATAGGTWVFRVSATDTGLVTATARVHVQVDLPPVLRLPASLACNPSSVIVLDGRESFDPDGDSLDYAWRALGPFAGLPITEPAPGLASFAPTPGTTYELELTVSDGQGGTARQTTRVVVRRNPIASIQAPSVVRGGQLVTLDGSGSRDPDGGTLGYFWVQTAGPGVQLQPVPTSAVVTFPAPLVTDVLTFRLSVANPNGGTSTRAVSVSVAGRIDDHANTAEAVGTEDVLVPGGQARTALVESEGDVDFFSFAGVPGELYRVRLASTGRANLELTLLDADGLTVLARGLAAPGAEVTLPGHRPPQSTGYYVRIRSVDGLETGGYRVGVESSADAFTRPPAFLLTSRRVAGQLEAVVASGGTSAPLSFLQFLVDYDAAALTLVGRSPEAAASGFSVNAQQYSPPFIDTLLESTGLPRPLTPGPLVALNLRPKTGTVPAGNPVNLLSASATPPPPLVRVTVYRPTADAGLPVTLTPLRGSDGVERLRDPLGPSRPLAPYLRLDGRVSSDPNDPALPLEYSWRLLAAPGARAVLSEPASPVPTVRLDGAGLYRFALTVSNGVLASPTSTVDVLVRGAIHPPHAAFRISDATGRLVAVDPAEGPVLVGPGALLTLDGTRSRDEDAGDGSRLSYAWTRVDGPVAVTLPARSAVDFRAFVAGTYRFELVVTDPAGLSSKPAAATVVVSDRETTPPAFSLTAIGSTTSAVGHDLGVSPATSTTEPLRVLTGTEVTIQAEGRSAGLDRGELTGLFFWRQLAGPVVSLTQTDTPPAKSRVSFTAAVAGVYDFECRLREATAQGVDLGLEFHRVIRLVVSDPEQPIPVARALVMTQSPGKGLTPSPGGQGWGTLGPAPRSLLANGARLSVSAGRTVYLVGSSPVVAKRGVTKTGTSPQGDGTSRRYTWVQTEGPAVELSDPSSPVTTFVAPSDDEDQDYAFNLYVDDEPGPSKRAGGAAGGDARRVALERLFPMVRTSGATVPSRPDPIVCKTRSAPAAVVVAVSATPTPPLVTETASLALGGGPNLIGVPFDPSTQGAPYDVAALAQETGATFVVHGRGSAPGTAWQAFFPGLGLPAPAVEGNRAYLVFLPASAARTVVFTGRPWPTSCVRPVSVARGLGLAALPGLPSGAATARCLADTLGASWLTLTEPGAAGRNRFRLLLSGTGDAPAMTAGRGFLYFATTARTASLEALVR